MRSGRTKFRPVHHSTGLRNRARGGRSTYCTAGKARTADSYGTWLNGHRTSGPERIAR